MLHVLSPGARHTWWPAAHNVLSPTNQAQHRTSNDKHRRQPQAVEDGLMTPGTFLQPASDAKGCHVSNLYTADSAGMDLEFVSCLLK